MEKEKLNLKRLITTIFLVLFAVGIIAGPTWYFMDQTSREYQEIIDSLQNQIEKLPNRYIDSSTVVISTDKTEYKKGENIKIGIKNNFNDDIYTYYNKGYSFYLETFNGNDWESIKGDNFQLIQEENKKVEDSCSLILFEQDYPLKLKSKDSIYNNWYQLVCNLQVNMIENIPSGQYRLSIIYGTKLSDNSNFEIKDEKTVYSDIFTIK